MPFKKGALPYNIKEITWIVDELTGCWNCNSHSSNGVGYAVISRNKKSMLIHRYHYELYNGEIPKGLLIRHKCDNRKCINPEHLETGTLQDNMDDMVKRGRSNAGEVNNKAKLTKEDVLKIRKSKDSLENLSKSFNVTLYHIQQIINRKRWKHI